jgi:hypothetical protein
MMTRLLALGLWALTAGQAEGFFGRQIELLINPDIHRDMPTEPHHTLQMPMDQGRVYWYWGGSTVVAKKKVSLTPPTADRNGFLWNDYPLESANWEVEFDFKVFSGPHFGGDGFGFWILDPAVDPVLKSEPDSLSGPLFGLLSDFKGFGVVFDTYDNDGDRKNPAIFVVENSKGGKFMGNHDNDYMDDMHKDVTGLMTKDFSCTADYRNREQPTRVLVRFLHEILHVYVDEQTDKGWQLCLALKMPKAYKGYHIAFTAHTGQVADAHEITTIQTRYLDKSEKDFDDFKLKHAHSLPKRTWGSFLWFLAFLLGLGVNGFCLMEIWKFLDYSASGINRCRCYAPPPLPFPFFSFSISFFFVHGKRDKTEGLGLYTMSMCLWVGGDKTTTPAMNNNRFSSSLPNY